MKTPGQRTDNDRHSLGEGDSVEIRRAQNGESRALEEVFSRLWPVCFRVARRMSGSDEDAKDIVQEAFVKALVNLGKFDHRCGFKTWLLRIVTNCATDHLRKYRRRRLLFDITAWSRGEGRGPLPPEPSLDHDPSSSIQQNELRNEIDRALAELSHKTRSAFVLYAEAEMTYQEVAETLKVPVGTIMSRIHSARKKLQVLMQELDNNQTTGHKAIAEPEQISSDSRAIRATEHNLDISQVTLMKYHGLSI